MRFGIIGAGRIGKIHAANVAARRDCEVAFVADADPNAAATLAEATGAKTGSVDEILDSSSVDAIAICSPTDTHADLIERGARAKKAIFCEKPIALDVPSRPGLPRGREGDRRDTDDRLQSPVRPEFRLAAKKRWRRA